MEQFFIQLVTDHPSLILVFTIIGVFRVVFKPIMAVIESGVKATPTLNDDAALDSFKNSPVYKWLIWFVDYATSIKLPGQK